MFSDSQMPFLSSLTDRLSIPVRWFFLGVLFFPLVSWGVTAEIISARSYLPLENLLTGMILESDRSLLILENDSGRVSRVIFNDAYETVRVEPLYEGFVDPVGLAQMDDGSLLVVEREPGRIVRLHNGRRETLLEDLDTPSSVRVNEDGEIIVAEMNAGRIISYNLLTQSQRIVSDDRRFPSDVLQIDQSLVIAELFERQGTFGQVTRVPKIFDSFNKVNLSWINNSFIIDPTRLAFDPAQPDTILVSVRQLKRDLLDETRFGAVLRLSLIDGVRIEAVLEELLSPTEVIAIRDGYFVIEERTERIYFFDRDGNRRPLWQGLGEPTSFSIHPHQEDALIIAESQPEPALVQVDMEGNRRAFFDEFDQDESIGGVYADVGTYVSFPRLGKIDLITPNGNREVFTRDVFSPGKMLPGEDDVLWVMDRLTNEIISLSKSGAETLNRIQAGNIFLADFQISVEPNGEEQLFIMDSAGKIYRYQSSRGTFQPLASLPPVERSLRNNAAFPPVFARVARVPGKGFIAALNDANGGLYWVDEMGNLTLLDKGFRDVSQLHFNKTQDELTVLSRRGWARTLNLDFKENEVRPPTPTPPITPIHEWNLHAN